MTRENIGPLIRARKRLDEQGNRKIIYILKENGPCTPRRIREELDKLARKYARLGCEKGEISFDDLEKIAKEWTLARETISRKLGKLVVMGVVTKNNSKYSLSESALAEIRISDPYRAKRIGSDVLINLLFQYLPVGKDLKERVKEIISIFGTYLLLSLMEACRPIDLQNDYKPIENKTKDAIAYQWIKNLIDPVVILDSFISNFARDYGYKERNSFIEKYSYLIEKRTEGSYEAFKLKQRFVDPFSGADAYFMNLLENIPRAEKTPHGSISRPNFEISQERVNAIENVMSELFPDYIMAMKIAYNRLLDLNKESIVQLKDQKYLHQAEEDLYT